MTGLSKKEKGFVKDYIETGSGVEAILGNYDTDDRKVARVMASQKLASEKIKNAIAERLPDDLLATKHLALLNKIDKEGEIDVQAVSKGLDLAYKVKGSYAPDRSINLNVEAEITNPKARELAEKYEEELKKGL